MLIVIRKRVKKLKKKKKERKKEKGSMTMPTNTVKNLSKFIAHSYSLIFELLSLFFLAYFLVNHSEKLSKIFVRFLVIKFYKFLFFTFDFS